MTSGKSASRTDSEEQRVALTSSCRDSDAIPKVPGAGELCGENLELQKMHNGITIRVGSYHGQWMTEVIRRLRGHHEPQEEKVFAAVLDCLPESATMVELGSFWAYYSMWFHKSVKQPRCILVEPIAEKLEAGKSHFQMNAMTGTFLRGFVGSADNPEAMFNDWDGARYQLPMFSVDGLMERFRLSRIDVLHADVQGAETDMLRGAERALHERRIGFLFISTHGCEHGPCLARLAAHGYHIIAAHTPLESFSGDGLIVAHAPGLSGPDHVEISRRTPPFRERVRQHLACLRRRAAALLGMGRGAAR
jgi:FkbM family methyltransferase